MDAKALAQFFAKAIALGLVTALGLYVLKPELFQAGATGGVVSYADAVRRASPAVVSITTAQFPDWQARAKGSSGTGLGSGVILRHDGYILTNNHVIASADAIGVTLADGRQTVAEIIGRDPATDLAVLRIPFQNLPTIPLASARPVQVGDVSMAIGNPYGIGQTVTMGIVSATGRGYLGLALYEDFIQTDAAINYGNSGGALINAYGELVGINSAFFSTRSGSSGISFAIPAQQALAVLDSILKEGRVVRGWLGLSGIDLAGSPDWADRNGLSSLAGVIITDVETPGPADEAGIERGDILVRVGNQIITGPRDTMRLIANTPPGSRLVLHVIRRGESLSLPVTIAEKPLDAQMEAPSGG
ncbi:MAG: trypsin-like peptidase domain-containing protein [Gammaproteobacteria bacterium]|nr:trypsin-like peptidase domain-containing protein [Gammaproteobacteria bacterium]